MENRRIEELINQYKDDIHRIAKKYFIADGSDDDLFQEALIGFVQGVNNYDWSRGDNNSEPFKKFVFMCVKRQLLDAVKKSNSKKNIPLNSSVSLINDHDQNMTEYVDLQGEQQSLNPEEIIMGKIELEEKHKMLHLSLSEFEMQVLDLYLAGAKQSDIAKELQKTTKSIDNTLQRIKSKLKKN